MPPNRLAEVDENVSSSSLLLAGKSLNERPDQSSFVDDSATLARALSTPLSARARPEVPEHNIAHQHSARNVSHNGAIKHSDRERALIPVRAIDRVNDRRRAYY